MDFDLFKLNNPILDTSPKSWICFKGKNLRTIVDLMVNKILNYDKSITKLDLIRIISKKLKCSNGPIAEVLYYNREWFPIPILLSFIYMTNCRIKFYKLILKNVEFIKCNSNKSQSLKAVRFLSKDLCKVGGAHAGDGNINFRITIEIKDLQIKNNLFKILKINNIKYSFFKTSNRQRIKISSLTNHKLITLFYKLRNEKKIRFSISYAINITDFYFYALEAYAKWIKNVFGLDLKVKKCKKENAFEIDYDNKIIARYLHLFLEFPLGDKAYVIKEPTVIKISNIGLKEAFLLGYMTFEGHVCKGYQVEVSSKSKKMIKNVHQICKKLEIPLKKMKQDDYGRWICKTESLNKKNIKRCLGIFEKNTEKWLKLNSKIKNARL